MSKFLPSVRNPNPRTGMYEKEFTLAFTRLCALICILKNKKLNTPNIFIEILRDQNVRKVYKYMCDMDTDYEAITKIIENEPNVSKSKYIKKFLNSKHTEIVINDKPRKTHL